MVSHVIKNRFKPPPLLSKGTFAGGLQERRRRRQRNGHQNVDTRILQREQAVPSDEWLPTS